MNTSTRAIKTLISKIPGLQTLLSPRDIARRETIMRAAEAAMAEFGRESFTLAQLANALEISPGVIRRHFIDLDGLLFEILERHLRALSLAIGGVADDPPDPQAARAAYLAHTRTEDGRFTQAHLLFTRDRRTLPPDEQEELDRIRLGQGAALGGGLVESALSLLDSHTLDAQEIEALFARRAEQRAARLDELAHLPTATARATESADILANARTIRPEPDIPKPAPRANEPDGETWPESVFDRHMRAQQARAGP